MVQDVPPYVMLRTDQAVRSTIPRCQLPTSQGPAPTMDRDFRALISTLNPCSNSFFSLEDVYDGHDAVTRPIKAAAAAEGDLYSSSTSTLRRHNEVVIEHGRDDDGGQEKRDIMREVCRLTVCTMCTLCSLIRNKKLKPSPNTFVRT